MFVTFVSQCEKKALKRTRMVLDAFADRIGDNTWQTVITQEGLNAVKKSLRKTATKSTAVSCHWLRSRSRSELLWIVGNKNKFNSQGIVPVNRTEETINRFIDDSNWKTINIIKYASVIAGLFHDFGKANILFQNKLNPDKISKNYEPYRHEWVSLRMFQTFVNSQNDIQWLEALSQIEKNQDMNCFKDGIDGTVKDNHPLNKLPPLAQLVAWLILTHHKLPLRASWVDGINPAPLKYIDNWFERFDAEWNSYNCNQQDLNELIKDNWFINENDLPYQSVKWRAYTSIIASEAISKLKNMIQDDYIFNNIFTAHLARLSLMLADHYYSAQDGKLKWQDLNYYVYANTDPKTKTLKQKLDEHLTGVSYTAGEIVSALPNLKQELRELDTNDFLTSNTPREHKDNFGWQDKAKKLADSLSESTLKQGFFGINMASTGKGKTICNAKIMYTLGDKIGRKRFSVALGLRTLTLQTGNEYRSKLHLNNEKLAIAVGGTAVKQLFENSKIIQNNEIQEAESGSESQLEFVEQNLFVDFSAELYQHSLSKWTKGNARIEKIIQAPVLVCTIDHLIPATEGIKGGRQIGPMLRLLTSDLIIDEPDDFNLEDLPALCRLIHWAGLLGCRVLLSTATMPPALTYAAFEAYHAGWSQYAKANLSDWNGTINSAWFDEENAVAYSISKFVDFKPKHIKFVNSRVKHLKAVEKIKHKAEIIPVNNNEAETIYQIFARIIQQEALILHKYHNQKIEQKYVSIGLVRMANINPLVMVAKELLKMKIFQSDIRIHLCVYHGHYPLAVRSCIENKLDNILKRNFKNPSWPSKELINQVKNHPENNHIFIVLASPVAEVGRDHDYDWAIIEPSSMRSIIQIAGRVLRHRDKEAEHANILLLDKNIKCLRGDTYCFERPGFELSSLKINPDKKLKLRKHDLSSILSKEQYQIVNSIQRVMVPDNYVESATLNLVSLEHFALREILLTDTCCAKLWWDKKPFWCGEMQNQQKFRYSKKDEALCLLMGDGKFSWSWKNENVYPAKWSNQISGAGFDIEIINKLEIADGNQFWFELNPVQIYEKLAKDLDLEIDEVGKRFGEVRLVNYENSNIEEYIYQQNLGLYKEL